MDWSNIVGICSVVAGFIVLMIWLQLSTKDVTDPNLRHRADVQKGRGFEVILSVRQQEQKGE